MLTLISINCLTASSLFARTGKSDLDKTLSATITGESRVCNGIDDVVYKTESGMRNYIWNISSGGIITAGEMTNTISVSWRIAGSQAITVMYNNPFGPGLIVSSDYQVTVDPLPDDAGTMTGPVRVCQGETEATYSVPPISSAMDYVWMIPAGATIISGANTNTIKVNYSATASSGNVAVYGTNYCGEGNVSGFYPIAVHETPSTPVIF